MLKKFTCLSFPGNADHVSGKFVTDMGNNFRQYLLTPEVILTISR